MRGLSCISCRNRKIACDREQPACSPCLLSRKECAYRARKRRKAPQKSRVLDIEARLAHIESQSSRRDNVSSSGIDPAKAEEENPVLEEEEKVIEWKDLGFPSIFKPGLFKNFLSAEPKLWQDQESLPNARVQQDLYQIYFQRVHPSTPMIHKSRFYQALTGHPSRVPPLALRYAMWAIAALDSTEYQYIAENFYTLSRMRIEDLETRGAVNNWFAPYAQCWYLLAAYEASLAHFTRAWMSVGKCVKIVQMMNLHRLDSPSDEEHSLPRASWTETEEWRRIFWAAYFADRWSSTISGHPLSIKDEDIYTNLPASEEAFEFEIEELGTSFQKADGTRNIECLSPFAASVFTTAMLGRCISHIHSQENHATASMDSDYWETHRQIDNSISHTFMSLPAHLRLSPAAEDVSVVFLHLTLHVMVILLHQMAIEKFSEHKVDPNFRQRSFQRCLASSVAIKNMIYSVKDLGRYSTHMWTSFCIYVAAGVFIDDLRTIRHSSSSSVDLGLLLIALKVIGAQQTISDFFAQRLESKIYRTGVDSYISTDLKEKAGIGTLVRTAGSGGRIIITGYYLDDEPLCN